MPDCVTVLSSMAVKDLLAALVRACEAQSGHRIVLESVGGVDAARRISEGEVFDAVVLASDAIDKLIAAGRLSGARVDLARSQVVVAVRAGTPRPDISNEESLKRTVLAARAIGCSTGPSGTQVSKLFERWGIADRVRGKIVTPPPGRPVGALLACGEVDLGFQQAAEMKDVAGVDVLGPLPAPISISTTFSGGICAASFRPDAARILLAFLKAPPAAQTKLLYGMEPA